MTLRETRNRHFRTDAAATPASSFAARPRDDPAFYVDPDNLLFQPERICAVREAAPDVYETIKTLDGKCADIYHDHPFYKPPDLAQMVRRLVESPRSEARN